MNKKVECHQKKFMQEIHTNHIVDVIRTRIFRNLLRRPYTERYLDKEILLKKNLYISIYLYISYLRETHLIRTIFSIPWEFELHEFYCGL